MTLTLGSTKSTAQRLDHLSRVVPAAAVWDAESAPLARDARPGARAAVRTLRVEHSGPSYAPANFPVVSGDQALAADAGKGSNVGTYLLGALFGLAMFGGIIAGDLGESQPAAEPTQVVAEVSGF